MDVREDPPPGDREPLRFSLRQMMQGVTIFCLLLGFSAWFFSAWPLAVLAAFIAMQLPLMLLVRNRLR
jgi:hypothetical protein